MRKVIIATPSYDGTNDVRYTAAMTATAKLCMAHGIDADPLFMCHGPVETLRNDLLAMALAMPEVTDLIWIDADMEWAPEWVVRLLQYPVDVVGGVARKKVAGEAYNVGGDLAQLVPNALGLMPVRHVGTGFMRLSRAAMQALWKNGEPYKVGDLERRKVFEWTIDKGETISEDVGMCRKLAAAGFTIFIDPTMCCNHIGSNVWGGDFMAWLEKLKAEAPVKAPLNAEAKRAARRASTRQAKR